MKNKYAVVTIVIGNTYNDLSKLTHPTIKAYADKIGADFIVWKTMGKHTHPGYQKLEIKELLKKYERVLYIDTDIIIREDSPNLFDVVPKEKVGLFNEGRFVLRSDSFYDFCRQVNFNPQDWDKRYFNTGVLVVSREHSEMFNQPPVEINSFYEQTYLNVMICHLGFKIHDLSYKFNRMSIMDNATGEPRHDAYFVHYAGWSMWSEVNKTQNILTDIINKDLQIWEESKPDYKFKKNIAVMVGGGLGDQIAGEPTVRYIKDYLYKGENIVVQTHWPEIFEHMKDEVKVMTPFQKIDNPKSYYELYTLKSPENEIWQYMSHTITHAFDFASICATRQQLPMKFKQIQLKVKDEDINSASEKAGIDLSKVVVLHPGRGWPSKTFTSETWQGWADILVENGYKVAVVGKRIGKDQGIVEFDMSKCIDLVDKLTIGELFAVISKAPVLISNDSAPVHIAGAFDNQIFLIATCKHPDYILPFRNGSIYYKAKNIEQFPIYDGYDKRPHLFDGSTIDYVDPEELKMAMPSPELVLQEVKNVFKS